MFSSPRTRPRARIQQGQKKTGRGAPRSQRRSCHPNEYFKRSYLLENLEKAAFGMEENAVAAAAPMKMEVDD